MLASLLLLLSQVPPEQCEAKLPPLLWTVGLSSVTQAHHELEAALAPLTDAEVNRVMKRVTRIRCKRQVPELGQWLARNGQLPYAQRERLDDWLSAIWGDIAADVTAERRELEALSGDLLCERAMEITAPLMRLATMPVGSTDESADAKFWSVDKVAQFFASACKLEKIHKTDRASLLCYCRARDQGTSFLEAIDDCDVDAAPSFSSFIERTEAKLEQVRAHTSAKSK